jgi:hypothetical protein
LNKQRSYFIWVSLLALCVLFATIPSDAYEFPGNKWSGAETEFHVALTGVSTSGVPWSTAFIHAMDDWNNETDFNFVLREEFRDPCELDFINSVGFSDNVCGSAFGANTIAVALRDLQPSILGPAELVEGDIVINSLKSFNVYDGPSLPTQIGTPANPIDFRRVVLHELGHVIGMAHNDDQPAIMNSVIGSTFELQPDDIDGVNALYGILDNCYISPVGFGRFENSLQPGDCTVDQLLHGNDDASFIDVRRLKLKDAATVSLTMSAASLDSVILIADSELGILEIDDDSGPGCDAQLTRFLPAGTYHLLANTYDESSPCGAITGPYALDIDLSYADLISLGSLLTVKGSNSSAVFSGGISSNDGASFGNRFSATDSLDVTGEIQIDPLHQGLPGFIVIAAVVDGDILLKNSASQFVNYVIGSGPLIKAASKTLEPLETLKILENLVPLQIGISNIRVDFFIGYGLDSNPQELYYHTDPITLVVEP